MTWAMPYKNILNLVPGYKREKAIRSSTHPSPPACAHRRRASPALTHCRRRDRSSCRQELAPPGAHARHQELAPRRHWSRRLGESARLLEDSSGEPPLELIRRWRPSLELLHRWGAAAAAAGGELGGAELPPLEGRAPAAGGRAPPPLEASTLEAELLRRWRAELPPLEAAADLLRRWRPSNRRWRPSSCVSSRPASGCGAGGMVARGNAGL
jgi:hypothetical protein